MDFWPGVADVCRVVGARWTARYQTKRGIDEFRIRAVRALGWARYLGGDGIIWDSSKKGVEIVVGLARVGRRGHRR